ncbi:MAG: phosphate ABC transporter permease subunit PstC [Gammaproteobacteria bacterium]|nr:phosphate ABC transporter permease subunit PstC [Gammaproteobacteria bacterium]MCP5135691.1 phosphate ABC transporter permease subunit PstC [Gammaproteobacteria bacterium]
MAENPHSLDDFDRRTPDWYVDRLMQSLVFIGGFSAIVFILGIFLFVAKEGLGFVTTDFDPVEFFTTEYWAPSDEDAPEFGILALIAGTAAVTGLAMLVAIPFALGAAIYIGEFATGKTREFLKVLVELLAAIPSVVWGFIGLSIMNPLIIAVFDVPVGLNVLNAGIILGLMAAPIMTSIAEDALKAVPDRYREAAEAMGATRWQVIVKVVLPAAKNGLLGAVLLGVGRGFGETMAVLMATGHSVNLPTSVFDSVRALTATIAAELGETAVGSEHYGALFTIGIFLFLITFVINMTADLIVRGVRKG